MPALRSRRSHPARAEEAELLCFATQGAGSGDQRRIASLLESLRPRVFDFDRERRPRMPFALLRELRRRPTTLVVMEGTGVAGGVGVLLARHLLGIPYVVSTGDAVGPFVAAQHPRLGHAAGLYERLLYRRSAGVIGWSPYLVGRALTLGAPRAMTAAHWSAGEPAPGARAAARERLGIPRDALVFGLVGSLLWDRRVDYCYGAELVRALRRTQRPDLRVLVVGDGDGRERLVELAGPELGRRVLLPGSCPSDEVADQLAAIDVASLPQSVDQAGALRYTTKLPEYLAAGLPVVTGELPLAYDLDDGWLWRLPGRSPWDERYVGALSTLMESLDGPTLAARRAAVPRRPAEFDRERQQRRVVAFVGDILQTRDSSAP